MPMILKIFITLLILFNICETGYCKDRKIPVMIVIDEKLPLNIESRAYQELADFLKQNGFELIGFPQEKKNDLCNLISGLMENNSQSLSQIAKDKGALFLICGKLQTMTTGTTIVYDATLNEVEIFGEIQLIFLNKPDIPLNMKLKEKGLSIHLQESYQQALGKALEGFERSIIDRIK
ncbi:MAG: hypothetical protein ABRQ38_22400 [Candidatus Eremiobacterota bacterium]